MRINPLTIALSLTTVVSASQKALAPPMPWFNVAVLNNADMAALFAHLKSLKTVANQVLAPLAPK